MEDQQHVDRPLESTNKPVASDAPIVSTNTSAKNGRLQTLILFLVGIASGTGTWIVAPGLARQVAALSEEMKAKAPGSQYNKELFSEIKAAERQGATKGSMVLFGMFGAIVGACLATVNGMLWRSLCGSLLGLAAGLTLGGGMGVLMGSFSLDLQDWLGNSLPLDWITYRAVLVHGTVWGGVGAGIGMAAGLSVLSIKEAARGMAIVGIAGIGVAFVYAAASAILVPMQNADQLIPLGSLNQWIWLALTSGIMGLAVATINRNARAQDVAKVVA